MTIGSDIPIKTPLDATVRSTAKGDSLPNQTMPQEGEDSLDFKSIVGTMIPKLKSDSGSSAMEDDQTDSDDTAKAGRSGKLPAAALVQGVFSQTILAFQQLLDKQQQKQDGQVMAPVKTPELDLAGPAIESDAAASAKVTAFPEPPVKTDALPEVKDSKVVDTPAATENTAEPGSKNTVPQAPPALASVSDKGRAKAVTVPAQTAVPKEAAAEEVLKDQSSAQTAAPNQPSQTGATAAPSPLLPASGQAETRLVVTPAPAEHPSNARSPAIDVQIISSRSSGTARTLVIQLQPIELGTVTARLRLTPDGMHIQLTAENSVAAERLVKDHDALGKALQRAGVTDGTSPVTISIVDRSSMASSTQTGQQNLNGQEQQSNPRASGENPPGFQGAPGDQSAGHQAFGDSGAHEREEKLAKPGTEIRASRGLVV